MRCLLLLCLGLAPLHAQGLQYRVSLWFRGAATPVVGRFTVDTTAPIRSHNRVQKPRLGAWVIRGVAGEDRAAEAILLARAPGLLFLSTPVPQAVRTSVHTRVGGRACAFWGLRTPEGLIASVALAQIGPDTLALMDLTAQPRSGDLSRVELHLESIGPMTSLAPPQDGTALLGTLKAWAKVDESAGVQVLR